MNLHEFLQSALTYRIGWTLLHSLWQGALIAAALKMTNVWLREKSSQSRYLAACLAMTCQLMLLVGTFSFVSGSQLPDSPITSIPNPAVFAPEASISSGQTVQTVSLSEAPSGTQTPSETPLRQRFLKLLDTAIPWLGCVWCGGVLALSFWNIGGLIAIHRLKTLTTRGVDTILESTFAKLLVRMQLGRRVQLLHSAIVESPLVIGVLRPMIVFPTGLLTQMSPEQIETVLIHELAHIRRWDYLVNLVQVAIDTLLFYHPATWWISFCIRSERENCCDDVVLETTHERTVYLTALAVIAESRLTLVPAASGAPLLPRIRRLVGVSDQRKQNSLVSLIILAIPLVLGIFLCSHRLAAQGTGLSEANTRTVVVWKVDPRFAENPQASVVPEELTKRAAEHHIQLKVMLFSGEGIAKVYADAQAAGTDPDILCFQNAAVYNAFPDQIDQCSVDGSLSNLAPGCWIAIRRSSPNHLAAKELALTFPGSGLNENLSEGIDPALEKLVHDFAKAHGEWNTKGINQLLDPSCLKDYPVDLFSVLNTELPRPVVLKKKISSIWHDGHLAVTKSMAIYESPNSIGCDILVTIAEEKQGHWSLVDFTNEDSLVEKFAEGIGRLSGKRLGPTKEPVLISPADGSHFAERFPGPKLEWRHVDENVEGYLVEAQFDGDPGKGLWVQCPSKVVRPDKTVQTLHCDAPAKGAQPHRWRVWAIYGDGSISISAWRTIIYTR